MLPRLVTAGDLLSEYLIITRRRLFIPHIVQCEGQLTVGIKCDDTRRAALFGACLTQECQYRLIEFVRRLHVREVAGLRNDDE